jgi:hypothetical protein
LVVLAAISAKGRLADLDLGAVALGLAFLAVVDLGIAVSPFLKSA